MFIRAPLIALFAVALAIAGHTQAEENTKANPEAKKCVQITSISSVRVIDNQHIKFEMDGSTDYMNTLPRKCPGLSKHTPIMYKTSLSQLCDLDTITVLNTAGGGFMRGATCGLGRFEPMPEEKKAAE